MPECINPLYPCAMTGAVSSLAGFNGIVVVIHGSSGCYYYPATLLHAPLTGTFILEEDVIFGSEERLIEVVEEIARTGKRIAVVTTCVPAILGEDIRAMLAAHDVILVDSPGFTGSYEKGYKKALSILDPQVSPDSAGINIDGVSLFDPFFRGNVQELFRLLALAGVPVATVLCADKYEKIRKCAPLTITTDSDLASGTGTCLGGTLGFDALNETFRRIGEAFGTSDPDPVFEEITREEERLVRACDKYLRRFDPPQVAIFSNFSYASFAAVTLKKYLDAEIVCIGSRTEPTGPLPFPTSWITDLADAQALIRRSDPDIVIGSSFERSVKGSAGFVGLTPPLRGRVYISPRPLAGTSGTLLFVEDVLNACMDKPHTLS
ncbi:MAG: Nitrogenase component 1 type Oxidoreductase [Methanoregula sp. PtaU1.Bin051]|nr:MAG: Nitrogenase component 1 type Oxidoreductase [Methanoregula sp. PtaU1.Bin051]